MVAVASLPKEIAAGLQPKRSNSIRGLLLQSGWVVEKLEDDSCLVTYVVQVSINTMRELDSHCSSSAVSFYGFVRLKTDIFCLNMQLDPAGWLPKCFVNRLNTKLVMIVDNLEKLAQACPINSGI